MGPHRDVRFVSSGVKLPGDAPAPAPALLSAALPFAHIGRAIDAAARRVAASLPRIPVARADTAAAPPLPLPRRHGKGGGGGGGEERVLISEVAVRGKDGEPLKRPELEAAAAAALRACRPNAALTVREVQEDVHRVVESGLFRSCMPVAVDTRDGIRLVFEVEPNQDFHGLVCEGANMLPSKFLQDAFRDRHGKIINIRHLDKVFKSVNGWYQERGLTGLVSYAEILSGGILRLQVSEAEVNNINIRFLDRRTGEPTVGKMQPETILRQLTTKKGQVSLQSNNDVKTSKEPAKVAPKEPTFTCPVCWNKLEEPSTTICGHIFCAKCIKQAIQVQKKCPTCRKSLRINNFHRTLSHINLPSKL